MQVPEKKFGIWNLESKHGLYIAASGGRGRGPVAGVHRTLPDVAWPPWERHPASFPGAQHPRDLQHVRPALRLLLDAQQRHPNAPLHLSLL